MSSTAIEDARLLKLVLSEDPLEDEDLWLGNFRLLKTYVYDSSIRMNLKVDGALNAQELAADAYKAIMNSRRGNMAGEVNSYARALLGAKGDGRRIIEGMVQAKVWGVEGPESYDDLIYTHQGYDMNKNLDRYMVIALYRSDRVPPILPLPFTPLHYALKRPNWITVDFVGKSLGGKHNQYVGPTGLKAVKRIEAANFLVSLAIQAAGNGDVGTAEPSIVLMKQLARPNLPGFSHSDVSLELDTYVQSDNQDCIANDDGPIDFFGEKRIWTFLIRAYTHLAEYQVRMNQSKHVLLDSADENDVGTDVFSTDPIPNFLLFFVNHKCCVLSHPQIGKLLQEARDRVEKKFVGVVGFGTKFNDDIESKSFTGVGLPANGVESFLQTLNATANDQIGHNTWKESRIVAQAVPNGGVPTHADLLALGVTSIAKRTYLIASCEALNLKTDEQLKANTRSVALSSTGVTGMTII